MPFRVAVVGRPRDPDMASLVSAYESRAARYWQLSYVAVKSAERVGGNPSLTKRVEGERLLKAVPTGYSLVACHQAGKTLDSIQFAEWLISARDNGGSLCFVVGGAYGLDECVLNVASRMLSLSPLTLPHDIAQIVLLEQLYRAGTIARNEPYHK